MLELFNLIPPWIFTAVSWLTKLFVCAFIFFSTRYRNGRHSPVWYISALFFPGIVFLVFLSKRKAMNGIGMKQCPVCHSNYPPQFVSCYKCNVSLPEYDEKKALMNKALAVFFAVLSAAAIIISLASGIFNAAGLINDIGSATEEGVYSRISFVDENGNTVFYDKNGEAYTDETDVALYNADGVKYLYNTATMRLHSSNGDSMDYYNSFVDKDGNLISNKYDEIYMVYEDGENDEDGEVVEFGSLSGDADYANELRPYYETLYTDDEGNRYYPAAYASWTKDGRLITSREMIEKP